VNRYVLATWPPIITAFWMFGWLAALLLYSVFLTAPPLLTCIP
jgi:CHASE2 domain-containing sensor protein